MLKGLKSVDLKIIQMYHFRCNGQFFPPGKDLTSQFRSVFPPGKDLTSQFFPTQSVFSPHVIFWKT